MAIITDYASLKTAVADWLDRTDMTALIPEFIQIAEVRMYRKLRIPVMEVATTLTTGAVTGKITIPSNFVELKAMAVLDGDNKATLNRRPVDEVRTDNRTGVPCDFSRLGTEWIFSPAPDAQYSVDVYYYGQLDLLSDANNQNYFTQFAQDILLYGALAAANEYLEDDEAAAKYTGLFERAINETQQMADDAEYAGSPLSVR